jgi:hypothetical protein
MKKIYCFCGKELEIINEFEDSIVVSTCSCQTSKSGLSCPFGHEVKSNFSECPDKDKCPKNIWIVCCQGLWNQ